MVCRLFFFFLLWTDKFTFSLRNIEVQYFSKENDLKITILPANCSDICEYNLYDIVCITSVTLGKIHCLNVVVGGSCIIENATNSQVHLLIPGGGIKPLFLDTSINEIGFRMSNRSNIDGEFSNMIRHHTETSLWVPKSTAMAGSFLNFQVLGTNQKPLKLLIKDESEVFYVKGLQPGTFSSIITVHQPDGLVIHTQTIFFEAVINSSEIPFYRLIPPNSQHVAAFSWTTRALPMPLLLRKIHICFVGGLKLDGQKSIWLGQLAQLSRRSFEFSYLTYESSDGDDDETSQYVLNRLKELDVRIIRVELPSIKIQDLLDVGVTDEPGGSSIIAQVVDRIIMSLNHDHSVPKWSEPWWEALNEGIRLAHPEIMVFANGREELLSDALLIRAARLQMGPRGRIVMELPNLYPDSRIHTDVLVAPSLYAATHFSVEAYLSNRIHSNVLVIPPGVNTKKFSPYGSTICHPQCPPIWGRIIPDREGSGVAEKCHVACRTVGFLARLAAEKSAGLFIMAAALVARELPFTRFTVIGDGELRGTLESLAQDLGIDKLVAFVGVAFLELPNQLRGFDVVVNPSLRAESETFCIANIEAMATGIPVVSFGVGGIGEYLRHGFNGWLVDEVSPQGLAEAVIYLLRNDTLRMELGRKARQTVSNEFSSELQMSRYEELYTGLVTSAISGTIS